MTSILFDFLTEPELREAVREEHQVLSGLLDQYHAALREAYASELGTISEAQR